MSRVLVMRTQVQPVSLHTRSSSASADIFKRRNQAETTGFVCSSVIRTAADAKM